jgi:hypothetical protein
MRKSVFALVALLLAISCSAAKPRARMPVTLTAEAATGTICGTAVHCVVLTWTASSDAAANPTLGYNIYKGTTSGGESTAALNGSTLSSVGCATATSTPPCEYVDTEVAVGQTIYYDIKASLNGVLSVASNEVTTEIGPAPPTAVSLASQ